MWNLLIFQCKIMRTSDPSTSSHPIHDIIQQPTRMNFQLCANYSHYLFRNYERGHQVQGTREERSTGKGTASRMAGPYR